MDGMLASQKLLAEGKGEGSLPLGGVSPAPVPARMHACMPAGRAVGQHLGPLLQLQGVRRNERGLVKMPEVPPSASAPPLISAPPGPSSPPKAAPGSPPESLSLDSRTKAPLAGQHSERSHSLSFVNRFFIASDIVQTSMRPARSILSKCLSLEIRTAPA